MTENPFDEKAAGWDTDPGHVERARTVADRIASEVDLDTSMRTLEYGAGTGLVSEMLQDKVGDLTLVDTSAGMREVMRSKVDVGRIRPAEINDFDVTDPNAPRSAFDLVITVLTLHHMDDTDAALAGFRRVLAPGGRLCVVDLDEEDGSFHGEGMHVHHGFNRHGLAHALEAAGFVDVAVSDCHHVEREDGDYPMFLAVATRPDN